VVKVLVLDKGCLFEGLELIGSRCRQVSKGVVEDVEGLGQGLVSGLRKSVAAVLC